MRRIALLVTIPFLFFLLAVPAAVAEVSPPLYPSSVEVVPRVLGANESAVTVSGRGGAGDRIVVTISALSVWEGTLGDADASGTAPFTTGPVDLSTFPYAELPVVVTAYDQVGNTAEVAVGNVDRRHPTEIHAAVTPLSIPWGTTVSVTGRLTIAGTSTGLGSRTVALLEHRDGGVIVSMGAMTTAADGRFTKVLVMKDSGTLFARHVATSSTRPSETPWSPHIAVGRPAGAQSDHTNTLAGAQAAAASPQGQWLTETLASRTDVDWYAFGVPVTGRHLIRLGHLPADYALSLYDRAGRQLAVSARPGAQYEEIYRALQAGTYFVRVSSSGGSNATVPYHLSFVREADTVVMLSKRVDVPDGSILLELLNNTPGWKSAGIRVDCLQGSTVVRTGTWLGVPLLPPLGRRPFALYPAACPSGTVMRLTVLPAATSERPPTASFTVAHSTPFTTTKSRFYPFTITNTGSSVLRDLRAGVCEYDTEGRLQAFSSTFEAPLAPGASRRDSTLEVWRSTPAPNRVTYLNLFN